MRVKGKLIEELGKEVIETQLKNESDLENLADRLGSIVVEDTERDFILHPLLPKLWLLISRGKSTLID